MLMEQCISANIADPIRADAEAMRAVQEFMKFIPARVLQIDIDTSRSNKQGIVDGDAVYKLGVILESRQVFIEYYEHRDHPAPTMALTVDRGKAAVGVKGNKDGHKFHLTFIWNNGRVEKIAQFD